MTCEVFWLTTLSSLIAGAVVALVFYIFIFLYFEGKLKSNQSILYTLEKQYQHLNLIKIEVIAINSVFPELMKIYDLARTKLKSDEFDYELPFSSTL